LSVGPEYLGHDGRYKHIARINLESDFENIELTKFPFFPATNCNKDIGVTSAIGDNNLRRPCTSDGFMALPRRIVARGLICFAIFQTYYPAQ
jgi:hypothetical protein